MPADYRQGTQRPKGWADWNPHGSTRKVLEQVQAILHEYRAYLPMTARQIFYRMVGQYGFEKTEKGYKRLCEYLVRARRSGKIPFEHIRDDGTVAMGGPQFAGPEHFWDTIGEMGDTYEAQRQAGQPQFIELWCEAAGMTPMLADAVSEWHIPVYSTGGFSSVTVTKKIADRALRRRKPTHFLHVGDYDPSGESIYMAMALDAWSFVQSERDDHDWFVPWRVALTEEQVGKHDLPTAPAKPSDSRSRNWVGETTQLEAMPPDLLVKTVREAVETLIDAKIFEQTLIQEETERKGIVAKLNELDVWDR